MIFTHNNTKHKRQIFIQKHAGKRTSDEKPLGKTLFVINIPPYINETQLRSAFSSFGNIENIIISASVADSSHETTNTNHSSKYFCEAKPIFGFKVAHIIFKSTKTLEKTLKASKLEVKDNATALCVGIEKWTQNYLDSLIDEKELQAEVEEYMSAFEEKEQEEREVAKKVEVDDDGWTVVKRGKAGGGFQQKQSILDALEKKIERGKEKKEFKNFYTFQLRQSKQRHIINLREKFQKDKLKIEALKKARRFKPY